MVSSGFWLHHVAMAKKTETRPSTATINPFGLRMQPELRERLEAAASEAGRSLNAEIVARLEESLPREPLENEILQDMLNLEFQALRLKWRSLAALNLVKAEGAGDVDSPEALANLVQEKARVTRDEIAAEQALIKKFAEADAILKARAMDSAPATKPRPKKKL